MVKAINSFTREWDTDPDIRVVIFSGARDGTFITHYPPDELRAMSHAVKQCKSDADVVATRRKTGLALRLVQLATRRLYLHVGKLKILPSA